MTELQPKKNFDDVESRRASASGRRLSFGRRLYYFLGLPLLRGIARLLWWSYRIDTFIGKDIADRVIRDDNVYAPCYWHQHTVLGLALMRAWIKEGFNAGFIISASVDGDVPARIAEAWGAKVIRGSAARTGALAMRDIHGVMKQGVSIVSAADGPRGPQYEFKPGVVLMSRIGAAPMISIGCAASRGLYLDRWDNFVIPLPFSRVAFAIGEPHAVPAGTSMEEMEEHRADMQREIISLTKQAEQALSRG